MSEGKLTGTLGKTHASLSMEEDKHCDSDEEFFEFLQKTKEKFSKVSLKSVSCDETVDNAYIDEETDFMKYMHSINQVSATKLQNSVADNPQSFISDIKNEKYEENSIKLPGSLPKKEHQHPFLTDFNGSYSGRKMKTSPDDKSFHILQGQSESMHAFSCKRDKYAKELFEFFNEKVFNDQLPKDLPLIWNGNLRTTAGKTICVRKKDQYTCSIELSAKILTSFDRLRDTLLHEMCHAAVWIVNKVNNVSHGPLWQIWAARCKLILPNIEVPERCHNYDIDYPYLYQCNSCQWKCGRYKRSQKLAKSCCLYCDKPVSLVVKSGRVTSFSAS